MSRVLLLLLFMLWMTWSSDRSQPVGVRAGVGVPVFLGGLAAVVLAMGIWSRMLARATGRARMHRRLRWFNTGMAGVRFAIPVLFAAGLYALGWGQVVVRMLGPVDRWDVQLPGIVLGTLPALAAWMGLWWSQYPVERALREQALVIQLENALPVHEPPGFWRYFWANLRLQVLFTLVPVLLIVLTRDVGAVVLRGVGMSGGGGARGISPTTELLISLGAAGLIFVWAPQILRRVLHTQPLPASSLRTRLEELCRRHGLRYRDILLWHTEGTMGNAAVMGVVPGLRYVLLSDVLLETMSDQQIEAVFAHELGHIVHRHMMWYVVFILAMLMGLGAVETTTGPWVEELVRRAQVEWLTPDVVILVMGVGAFLLLFGYLSRRLERQADVFAARTMEGEGIADWGLRIADCGMPRSESAAGTVLARGKARGHVGPHGAWVFATALERVAGINNIPRSARSWCHGSIAKRMEYLHHLSQDPKRTRVFDRAMVRVYAVLVAALLLSAGWTVAQAWRG